jgi:hypothetical protein
VTIESGSAGVVHLDFELAVRPVRLGGITVDTDRGANHTNASALDPAGPPPFRLSSPGQLKYVPGIAEPDVLRAYRCCLPSL